MIRNSNFPLCKHWFTEIHGASYWLSGTIWQQCMWSVFEWMAWWVVVVVLFPCFRTFLVTDHWELGVELCTELWLTSGNTPHRQDDGLCWHRRRWEAGRVVSNARLPPLRVPSIGCLCAALIVIFMFVIWRDESCCSQTGLRIFPVFLMILDMKPYLTIYNLT